MNTVDKKQDVEIPASLETLKLKVWQMVTMMLMLVGYAGYYLCRSDLSIATPVLIQLYSWEHVNKIFIGGIATAGTLAYAIGKFINGSIADYVGGKRMFLFGMGGAIVATLIFVTGGIPFFTIGWVANRFVQSTGWVGMVKLTGKWYSFSRYGAVMGIISLSFLFGDFLSRLFLGHLLNMGFDWRMLFYIPAFVLGVILVFNILFLKESPKDIGEKEPECNPGNLFGSKGYDDKQGSFKDLMIPLLRSPVFWSVCALSFGFTLLREAFNNWTPDYLTDVAKMSDGNAGMASSLFPLFGGFSVIACGFLSDRLGATGRAVIIIGGLILIIPALLALGFLPIGHSALMAEILLCTAGFVMLGPYSFLAGAVSLDFGGKKGSATAAGWIDGIGYFGGMLAGSGVGAIAEKLGWGPAFLALAVVALLSCIAAAAYWKQQRDLAILTAKL
jgi:sugar phosphate permease